METNLMPMLTDVGFPIGLCLILLYGFKKVGEVLLARVVDPVITSHREFLIKLEQQLELQGELVRKMVSIQEEILRKLDWYCLLDFAGRVRRSCCNYCF